MFVGVFEPLNELQYRIHDAVMTVDEGLLRRAWDETAFRWMCAASPVEATSSTYEQKLECWATDVEEFVFQYDFNKKL
jgi:hypothetical protein